jgi:hypothetical protein
MTPVQKSALLVYFLLLLICGALIIGSDFLGPAVRTSLLPVATEGFKLVLAALVGAISTVLGTGATAKRQTTRGD